MMRINRRLLLRAAAAGVVSGLTPARASDPSIKIGILTDMSGTTSAEAGMGSVISAKLAVEDFGGSVLGRPIVVLSADHQNKADTAVTIAREWFDVEGVQFIGDLQNSAAALAVQDLAREKQRISVVTSAVSSDLTGKGCSPTGFHWNVDSYALARAPVRALLQHGKDTWFFVTADYAFGHAMERDATAEIKKLGGKVLGSVHVPQGTMDFSSYILSAQASGAKVLALANAGQDAIATIKQAAEFGLMAGDQIVSALAFTIASTHALGLDIAQGLWAAETFYWDRDDASRDFSKKFFTKAGTMPSQSHAAIYSAVSHYLKSVKAESSHDVAKVATRMRAIPVSDFYAADATLREDGRLLCEVLLLQAKKPHESRSAWDIYHVREVIAPSNAWRPLSETACPFLISRK
jgi:branched-chain amino acid transport system substrate-binding protein